MTGATAAGRTGGIDSISTGGGAETAGPWDGLAPRTRWLFLAILFLIVTSSYADRHVLPVVLGQIKAEFHISDTMLGILGGTPFTICYVLFSLPFARAADHGNRKRVMLVALFIWSVATGLCGAATSLWILFVARMGVGVGEGGSIPPVQALLTDYFPPRDRGKAFAALSAAGTAGSFLALAGGGWLAAHFGWRGAFLGMALFSLPVAVLAALVLVEPARPAGHRAAPTSFKADLLDLWRKPSFVYLIMGVAIYALYAWGPITTFIPLYMTRHFGVELAHAGSTYGSSVAIGTLAGTALGAALIDRLQRRNVYWLLALPAWGMLATLPISVAAFSGGSITQFLLLNACIYALLSAVTPALAASVQFVCGEQRRATAAALFMMAINLVGATLGPLATGALSDALAPYFGADSLRYAMMLMGLPLVPAAMLFLRGAPRLANDAKRS